MSQIRTRGIPRARGMSAFRSALRWGVLVLVVFAMGPACAQDPARTDTMAKNDNVEKIPPDVKKAIVDNVAGANPSAVFVVNQDGTVISLTDKSPIPVGNNVRFPRKKSEVTWTQNITIFKYDNPSVCIIIGGSQRCY